MRNGDYRSLKKAAKRIITIILAAAMAVSLCGCGNSGPRAQTADFSGATTAAVSADTGTADAGTGAVPEQEKDMPGISVEIDADDEPAPETTEEQKTAVLTFRFAGDFTQAEWGTPDISMMAIMNHLDNAWDGDLTRGFSDDLVELMQSADVFMLNNEFPYTKRGTPVEGKKWTFRADPKRVYNLLDIGVDIVTLANNHAVDWGPVSVEDSIDTLDGAGILHVGAGRDLAEAAQPAYIELGGKTFSFVGATMVEHGATQTRAATSDSPGVLNPTVDPQTTLNAVKTAKENSDYCFVFMHWGKENYSEITDEQREWARKLTDAGADAIIGAHTHRLQGIEYVNGCPVMYGLGNYWFNSRERTSGLYEITIDTADMNVQPRFYPALQKDFRTVLITNTDSLADRLSEMRRMSPGIVIDENGYIFNDKEND